MKLRQYLLLVLLPAAFQASAQKAQQANIWLTNADRSALFAQQKPQAFGDAAKDDNPTITVDDKTKYQPIDGFGYALTGGSALHIVRMSASARAALLKELFAVNDNNIGVSYIRLSIGASDLNDKVFTYDDMPAGQTDPELKNFDLGPDKIDVIPVMKELLRINPKIKILGSPWTAPVWMKTNGDTRGGSLKREWFQAYANYFVKYIKAYKAQGITIDAITVQNEPLHPGNNPSMLMYARDQADFIKNNLGPAFKSAGLKTKIIVYDHNADRPDYPDSIYNDKGAAKYVDGAGFHLYKGPIDTLNQLHNAHPEKNLYFTEQMIIDRKGSDQMNVAGPVGRLFVGATRNWCRNVLEWNLAADMDNQPHTDRGGCPMCQGAVTIDKDKVVNRSVAYYAMAHASKFVRPGSVRIASNLVDDLPNVAFRTPNGKNVLIVANVSRKEKTFHIQYLGKTLTATLKGSSAATYVW